MRDYSHEKGYDIELDCHGGITYNKILLDENWIGFDCAHSTDVLPSLERFYQTNEELRKAQEEQEKICEKLGYNLHAFFKKTYKNMEFCINECKNIVDQLIEMENKEEKL